MVGSFLGRQVLVLAALGSVAACSSSPAAAPPPVSHGTPSPNPCAGGAGLDPDACLLPWPSSAFLVADATTRTGFRIAIPAKLMPVNAMGKQLDPGPWNAGDGFSPMTTLIADFAQVIDPSPLPTWHDPGPSLQAGSPTVVVDVDTGQRIAHFSEIETSPDVAPGHTTLYIRPAARLAEGHHYAVGIRSLKNADGTPTLPTSAFAELRDGTPSLLEARRAAFEHDVFAPLVAAGVERSSLVLAWDFRTGSGQTAWGDLVAMRDAAFAAAGASGLGCSVTSVMTDPTNTMILRQISGTITVPNFLVTAPDGTLRLARDATGKPTAMGTTQASFIAIVPYTAAAKPGAAPLWVYGHGLFSNATEVTRDFGQATTSQAAAVAVATNYLGLTDTDINGVVSAVQDLNLFPTIIDQLRQGIVNTLLLPRTVAGACASLPAFTMNGVPIASTSDLGYFGNSMGGTLGQTVAALSPDISRFALGVGGIDFPVMMPRTNRWSQLQLFYGWGYPTRLDRDLMMIMEANVWDLAESSTFAPHVLADPLPGSHASHVLFHMGLYDCDTTNVASEMAGRTLGLEELTPSAHPVWGLPPAGAPLDNAYVVYDLGAQPLPDGTTPAPVENGVHEGVRRDPRAQAQLVAFLHAGGSVVDTCNGPCAP